MKRKKNQKNNKNRTNPQPKGWSIQSCGFWNAKLRPKERGFRPGAISHKKVTKVTAKPGQAALNKPTTITIISVAVIVALILLLTYREALVGKAYTSGAGTAGLVGPAEIIINLPTIYLVKANIGSSQTTAFEFELTFDKTKLNCNPAITEQTGLAGWDDQLDVINEYGCDNTQGKIKFRRSGLLLEGLPTGEIVLASITFTARPQTAYPASTTVGLTNLNIYDANDARQTLTVNGRETALTTLTIQATPAPTCGNHLCEAGETATGCPADCAALRGSCASSANCVENLVCSGRKCLRNTGSQCSQNDECASGGCNIVCVPADCTSATPEFCQTELDCYDVGGAWNDDTGRCSPTQGCGRSNLAACTARTACESAGGEWKNNLCQARAVGTMGGVKIRAEELGRLGTIYRTRLVALEALPPFSVYTTLLDSNDVKIVLESRSIPAMAAGESIELRTDSLSRNVARKRVIVMDNFASPTVYLNNAFVTTYP